MKGPIVGVPLSPPFSVLASLLPLSPMIRRLLRVLRFGGGKRTWFYPPGRTELLSIPRRRVTLKHVCVHQELDPSVETVLRLVSRVPAAMLITRTNTHRLEAGGVGGCVCPGKLLQQGLVRGSRLHLLILPPLYSPPHPPPPGSISAQLEMRTNIIKCNQRRCCVFVLGPRSCVTQHGLRLRPAGALD